MLMMLRCTGNSSILKPGRPLAGSPATLGKIANVNPVLWGARLPMGCLRWLVPSLKPGSSGPLQTCYGCHGPIWELSFNRHPRSL